MSYPGRMLCHITDERVPNDPQNAVDDTRPDGCECRHEDEDGHNDPATEHDDTNERCPLFLCSCGHERQEHGACGCEHIVSPNRHLFCACNLTAEQVG